MLAIITKKPSSTSISTLTQYSKSTSTITSTNFTNISPTLKNAAAASLSDTSSLGSRPSIPDFNSNSTSNSLSKKPSIPANFGKYFKTTPKAHKLMDPASRLCELDRNDVQMELVYSKHPAYHPGEWKQLLWDQQRLFGRAVSGKSFVLVRTLGKKGVMGMGMAMANEAGGMIDPTLRVARKRPVTFDESGALEIYPRDFLNTLAPTAPMGCGVHDPSRTDSVLQSPVQLDGAGPTPLLNPSNSNAPRSVDGEQTEKEKPEVVIRFGYAQLQRDWIYLISEVPVEERKGG